MGQKNETGPNVMKTALGSLTVEEGFVGVVIDVPVLDPAVIKEHLDSVLRFSQQSGVLKMPVLLDLGGVEWFGWEARVCAAEMLRPEWNERVAFLYHNPVQEVFCRFFANAARLEFPWIITGDREAAIEWLRSNLDGRAPGPVESPRPAIDEPLSDMDEVFGLMNKLVRGEEIERPRLSEAMDEADAVKAGIALLSEDMRKVFEERDRFVEEGAKHRGQLEELVRVRTEEVKQINESLMREIVFRKGTEEELRRTNMELEQFSTTVFRDLKAPLAIILAGCETIARIVEGLEDPYQELSTMADLVRRNAGKVNRLIEDMLSLAQVGQVPSSITDVSINEIVNRVAAENAELIEERGAVLEPSGDLGVIRANENHMYRLFSNLIINAIEHNPKPSPWVSIEFKGAAEGGNRYLVCDNGKGVPDADAEMIFFPFYSAKTGKTGLGLAAVQKIVTIYGGEIKAYNRPDAEGACFDFTIREFRHL